MPDKKNNLRCPVRAIATRTHNSRQQKHQYTMVKSQNNKTRKDEKSETC
jgi:hypothetical protein